MKIVFHPPPEGRGFLSLVTNIGINYKYHEQSNNKTDAYRKMDEYNNKVGAKYREKYPKKSIPNLVKELREKDLIKDISSFTSSKEE